MTDMPDGPDAAAPGGPAPASGGWKGATVALAQCLRFYSRLPVPRLAFEHDPHAVPDFATLPRLLPLAGVILGGIAGLALLGAGLLGLPPLLAAGLAVTAAVVTTGCFGEDGLADAADGLFGGATPARRLEIMSDSRVGSYGVAALALSLVLRIAALSALVASAGWFWTAGSLVASGALSRLAGIVPLWALPPAKRDGRSASVGRPTDAAMRQACLLAAALALAVLLPGFGPLPLILALAGAAGAALLGTRLSRRRLGGQTGDMAGATQQVAEIAILVALCVRLP